MERNKSNFKVYTSVILLVLLYTSVKGQLMIDPLSGKGCNFSEIFSSAEIIPLETVPQSVFGDIHLFEKHKGIMYIYDNDTHSVLLFKENGKFIKKITSKDIVDKKNKNNEIFGFSLDLKDDFLRILYSNGLAKFSLKGEFSGIQQFTQQNTSIYYKGDQYILNYLRNRKTNSFERLRVITSDNQIRSFDTLANINMQSFGFLKAALHISQKALYTKGLDYTVYDLHSGAPQPKFTFMFPYQNTIDTTGLAVDGYAQLSAIIKNQPNGIYALDHVLLVKNKLFFQLKSYNYLNGDDLFVYNLENNTNYSIKNIKPDHVSSDLKLINTNGVTSFKKFNFICAEDEYLYLHMAANELAQQSIKNSNLKLKDTDNPVIIKLKVK